MFLNIIQFFFNYPIRILLFTIIYSLKLKKRKYFYIYAPIITAAYILAFYFIPLPSYLYDIVLCSLSFVWIFVVNRCSAIDVLYSTVNSYAGGHIAQYLIQFIFTLTRVNDQSYLGMILSLLISLAVVLPTYFLLIKKIDYSVISKDAMTIITATIILVILLFAGESLRVVETRLTTILFYILGIFCSFYCLFMQYNSTKKLQLKIENSKLEEMILQSEKIAQSSITSSELLNIRCHDLKKQIELLEKSSDSKEKEELLEDMKETTRAYDSLIKTGYKPVDIVLSEKYRNCELNSIRFSYIADGKLLKFMREVDIYSLLANGLDNAIEAELKEDKDKRVISLSIRDDRDMVHIRIENYSSKEIEFKDGIPISDKEKGLHGYGCKSMIYIANRYHGIINMKKIDERFILDILFEKDSKCDQM